MVACTRRIAPVSHGTKATSLGTVRADHAAWCMPSPQAPDPGNNHLVDCRVGSGACRMASRVRRRHAGAMTETLTYKQLRRSRSDRMVAGVSGGLGRYFDVNPVLYR